MYIRQLAVENLRCFSGASIDFLHPARRQEQAFAHLGDWPPAFRNVNVILGTNGAGKSTLLDGIALAILSSVIASSGYKPYSLIRRNEDAPIENATLRAELLLHGQDRLVTQRVANARHSAKTIIRRRGDHEVIVGIDDYNSIWEGMFDDSSPAFLLVGYGATRRVEATSTFEISARRKSRHLRYERVASLFEDHYSLTPLSAWLPDLEDDNPGRHKQVVNLINRLLPRGTRFTGQFDGAEYIFRHRSVKVPFGALSDGFRSYIGWIGDLLYHVCMGCPPGKKLVDNRGVVLVDEIDLHIHPEWQLSIVPRLARALPKLQFILTTHSPIVVGTLEQGNIHHLRTSADGSALVECATEELFGLTADQVLHSSVFGLTSSRAPKFVKELHLLASKASSGEKGAARELMRRVARGKAARTHEDEEPPEWVKKASKKKHD